MTIDRVCASRRIHASATNLFVIVSHPQGHVRIDGSGMLTAAPDAHPLVEVGQTFDMEMDRVPLGDIPALGAYLVRNTVTQIVPDRIIEWAVGAIDRPPYGHLYGWQLEPIGPLETEVTNYCDWSNISEEMRSRRQWPVVPVHMLQRSVDSLHDLVRESATGGR